MHEMKKMFESQLRDIKAQIRTNLNITMDRIRNTNDGMKK